MPEMANAKAGWTSSAGHREMAMGDYKLLAELAAPSAPEAAILIVLRIR